MKSGPCRAQFFKDSVSAPVSIRQAPTPLVGNVNLVSTARARAILYAAASAVQFVRVGVDEAFRSRTVSMISRTFVRWSAFPSPAGYEVLQGLSMCQTRFFWG